VKEKCLKTLSEYRQRRCRCHVWWKTVPEVGAGNRKSPFADGGEIEGRYCKLDGGSRPESLLELHVSNVCSMTTDTLVHCRSKLERSLRRSWTGCAPGREASVVLISQCKKTR